MLHLHLKIFIISILFIFYLLVNAGFPQDDDIDFSLDINGRTKTTPNLLQKPGIDLSGRGFHSDPTWPQNLAARQVLDQFAKELNLQGGIFRLQFDLWEFVDLAKNKYMQVRFLEHYSEVIRNINSIGGIVILDLYGMPPGLGKVLDKKSSPWDIKAFKELVKDIIRYLSCQKGYDIWYEVWNAPDLDDFFLGQKKEYFNMYQAVAGSIQELEKETNHNIPIGGPGVTWWFQNLEGNSVLHPEKSLIYELIRFCSQRRLPLDFISWHAYTSDPFAESEVTPYKKAVPELIREWLSYFGLDSTIPLIISEWNYDAGINFEPRRGWESYIASSFIPSRIRNMLKSGIDYQIFFSLEDFKNNKQGINRNVGLFWFEPQHTQYAGGPKSMFNVIRMLNMLGNEMYLASRLDREFVGIIATKTKSGIAILLFNYIDPEIASNYLSRHLAELHPKLIRNLVNLINSDKWEKILNKEIPLKSLRINRRLKTKIKEAVALNEVARSKASRPQNINLDLTNLEGDYIYKKYVVDKTCRLDCAFSPKEEKEIEDTAVYNEILALEPYSVVLITMEEKTPILEVAEEINQVSPVDSEAPDWNKPEEESN
jgi:beta-xylosidase